MVDPIKLSKLGEMPEKAEPLIGQTKSLGHLKTRFTIQGLNTKTGRYAIAYELLSTADTEYAPRIRNPITKRYWVPLQVINDQNQKVLILANKASLAKRLGINPHDLNESIKDKTVQDLVNRKAQIISQTLDTERVKNEKKTFMNNLKGPLARIKSSLDDLSTCILLDTSRTMTVESKDMQKN